MAIQKRPDEKIFASKAGSQEVSAFPDVERGWGFTFEQTGGIPTMEHFNALFKRIDEHFNYMLQRGLPEWSATLDYPVGACVQYDNKTYRAKKASKNQRPDIVDSTYWVRWSIDYKEVSDFIDEAGKKGVPLGAVVAFPKGVNPHGYLRAIGGTFNRATYPDFYVANGNSEIIPNLHRSDVGMTAYFPFDDIPEGWIAFDSIRSIVRQQNYPELYQYLVDKYGSISNVPLAEDRFIRNVGNGLSVGQTQSDEIKKHVHKVRSHWINSSDSNVFYDKTKTVIDSRLRSTSVTDDNLNDNGFMHPLLDGPMATGGAETRPRAIALKLCIKAKNSFDDVQFWIKAFGVVENAGALDAGTLAQNMQSLSAHVERKLQENKQLASQEINNVKSELNQQLQTGLLQVGVLKTVWQGNVGSGRINISEKCFGKTLILYLQSSVSHRLDDNYNIEPVSFEVGAEIEGKRGGVYWLDVRRATYNIGNYTAGERFAVTVDRNGTTIQIQHLAGRFVKRIDIR